MYPYKHSTPSLNTYIPWKEMDSMIVANVVIIAATKTPIKALQKFLTNQSGLAFWK